MSRIINTNCTKCGACLDVCPPGAILVGNPYYRIGASACVDCGNCDGLCGYNAIMPLVERANMRAYRGGTPLIPSMKWASLRGAKIKTPSGWKDIEQTADVDRVGVAIYAGGAWNFIKQTPSTPSLPPAPVTFRGLVDSFFIEGGVLEDYDLEYDSGIDPEFGEFYTQQVLVQSLYADGTEAPFEVMKNGISYYNDGGFETVALGNYGYPGYRRILFGGYPPFDISFIQSETSRSFGLSIY